MPLLHGFRVNWGPQATPGALSQGGACVSSTADVRGQVPYAVAPCGGAIETYSNANFSLLNTELQVHGKWGSGQLVTSGLLNALITSQTVYIGAVEPSVLYAAAAASS